jgi:hypothetical protein
MKVNFLTNYSTFLLLSIPTNTMISIEWLLMELIFFIVKLNTQLKRLIGYLIAFTLSYFFDKKH